MSLHATNIQHLTAIIFEGIQKKNGVVLFYPSRQGSLVCGGIFGKSIG